MVAGEQRYPGEFDLELVGMLELKPVGEEL